MISSVIQYDDNSVYWNDSKIKEQSQIFKGGLYNLELDRNGMLTNFTKLKLPYVHNLLPSDEIDNIKEYMDTFASEEYKTCCNQANIIYKGGLLLYGKEGLGKSTFINYIINKFIKEKDAIIFNIKNTREFFVLKEITKKIRDIQPNLIVVILEEMDEYLAYNEFESALKNYMDGIDSLENMFFLATTNYFHKIPDSLKRPSRFKKIAEIKITNDTIQVKAWLRTIYKSIIPDIDNSECEDLDDQCINLTVDEIKHKVLDYKMKIKRLVSNKVSIGFNQNR